MKYAKKRPKWATNPPPDEPGALAGSMPPPPCERCKDRPADDNRTLCKKCYDDDVVAAMNCTAICCLAACC